MSLGLCFLQLYFIFYINSILYGFALKAENVSLQPVAKHWLFYLYGFRVLKIVFVKILLHPRFIMLATV